MGRQPITSLPSLETVLKACDASKYLDSFNTRAIYDIQEANQATLTWLTPSMAAKVTPQKSKSMSPVTPLALPSEHAPYVAHMPPRYAPEPHSQATVVTLTPPPEHRHSDQKMSERDTRMLPDLADHRPPWRWSHLR